MSNQTTTGRAHLRSDAITGALALDTDEASGIWHEPRYFEERFLVGILTLFSMKYGQFDYYWNRRTNTDPSLCVMKLRRSAGSFPSYEDMQFYGVLWS